jgi:hypothetical protein
MLTIGDEAKPSFAVMLACGEKVVVGRSRTCEIILNDPSVSRKHCFFGVGQDGILKLVDLGAQHPTLLNGVALQPGCSVQVRDGCQIRLGRGSSIKIACLGKKTESRTGPVDAMVDEGLDQTQADVPQTAVLSKVAGVELADDPYDDGQTRCSENDNSKAIASAKLHDDMRQPASAEDNGRSDEKSRGNVPRDVSSMAVSPLDQQAETSLVGRGKFIGQQQPSQSPIPSKIDEGNPALKKGTLVEGNGEEANVDEPKTPKPAMASNQSIGKKIDQSFLQGDASLNHTQVVGKTLQGRLILPEDSKPSPVLNGPVQRGIESGALNVEEVMMTSLSGGDGQDETSFVDPKELQNFMQGQKKDATPPPRGKAADLAPPDGDLQDETNFIDPAEIQKIMRRKASRKGRKKDPVRKGEGQNADESQQSDLDGDELRDETNYIDPSELPKLMKSKARLLGKIRNKKGAVSQVPCLGIESDNGGSEDSNSQDKTNYIDPSELQKLMKGNKKPSGPKKGWLR